VLNNIEKVCLDPQGEIANAELLKNQTYADEQDYTRYINENPQQSEKFHTLNIQGENAELSLGQISKTVIKAAIINDIKQNPND
jgi:hypothetical protein